MAAPNVTRLPTAAKRKVPAPILTGRQLAERGIIRILPDGVELRRSIPFDPDDPNHVRAWESLLALGHRDREGR